jgi:hypothetical protein
MRSVSSGVIGISLKEENLMEFEKQAPKGIAGWLLLPAITLCVQPISFIYKTISVLNHTNGFTRIYVIWPSLWFDLLLLSMVAVVSWGFFRKRSFAAHLFVAYIALMWIFWAIISGVSHQHMDDGLIGMLFHLTVLVPYLVFSRRAETTFVLEPENPLDHFLAGLSKFPAALFRFPQRQRWFIIIYIVVFFVAVMVFNAAVRSLYLNGNLKETWRLIVG